MLCGALRCVAFGAVRRRTLSCVLYSERMLMYAARFRETTQRTATQRNAAHLVSERTLTLLFTRLLCCQYATVINTIYMQLTVRLMS